MRCPPPNVRPEDVVQALDADWQLGVNALNFVPLGAGAHHWVATSHDGRCWFVTCDDLDTKPWLGSERESVFIGLNTAYGAARRLREGAGLDFVVAPIPTAAGEPTTRLDARHSVAVFPYIEGKSGRWGEPLSPSERQELLERLAELHEAYSAAEAPTRLLADVSGRKQLEAAFGELDEPWSGGPFSEPLREELNANRELVAHWAREFDEMASDLSTSSSQPAVTHGEPHPGNLMRGTGGLLLIDWDTIAIDRPERDLWMLEDGTGSAAAEYERLTGRSIDPLALMLYRRAWVLTDLAAFVAQLRDAHDNDEDSRKAWISITGLLRMEEPSPFGAPAPER